MVISTGLTREGAQMPTLPWTPSRLQRPTVTHSKLQKLTSTIQKRWPGSCGFTHNSIIGEGFVPRERQWMSGSAVQELGCKAQNALRRNIDLSSQTGILSASVPALAARQKAGKYQNRARRQEFALPHCMRSCLLRAVLIVTICDRAPAGTLARAFVYLNDESLHLPLT